MLLRCGRRCCSAVAVATSMIRDAVDRLHTMVLHIYSCTILGTVLYVGMRVITAVNVLSIAHISLRATYPWYGTFLCTGIIPCVAQSGYRWAVAGTFTHVQQQYLVVRIVLLTTVLCTRYGRVISRRRGDLPHSLTAHSSRQLRTPAAVVHTAHGHDLQPQSLDGHDLVSHGYKPGCG